MINVNNTPSTILLLSTTSTTATDLTTAIPTTPTSDENILLPLSLVLQQQGAWHELAVHLARFHWCKPCNFHTMHGFGDDADHATWLLIVLNTVVPISLCECPSVELSFNLPHARKGCRSVCVSGISGYLSVYLELCPFDWHRYL